MTVMCRSSPIWVCLALSCACLPLLLMVVHITKRMNIEIIMEGKLIKHYKRKHFGHFCLLAEGNDRTQYGFFTSKLLQPCSELQTPARCLMMKDIRYFAQDLAPTPLCTDCCKPCSFCFFMLFPPHIPHILITCYTK